MRRLRAAVAGLGGRVATRIFLLFALCALLPIALFAIVAQRTVSDELRELAATRLTQAGKAYGHLLFERLRQSEQLLSALAQAHLDNQLSAAGLRAFSSPRVRILDVQIGADVAPPASGSRLTVVRASDGEPQIVLSVSRATDQQWAMVTAAIRPEHLWDPDAVALAGASLCVREEHGALLHCAGDVDEAVDARRALAGEWSLFLRPAYGASTWVIEARQPAQVAFAASQRFGRTFPLVAGGAMALALLLSVTQIRRSHRPLEILTAAAQRIAERRAARPIVLDARRDEYGRLARAFNEMVDSVAQQFAILGALARIDRMILADPSIAEVLERTLPKLPRLTRARAAAAFVQTSEFGETLFYAVYRDRSHRVSVQRMLLSAEEMRMLLSEDPLPAGKRPAALRAEILAAANCAALEAAPIRVERRLRGVLLLAHVGAAECTVQRRYARSFARRFAVALGAQQRREALLHQAYYDDLTGLPNRQLFKDRLQQELARARRADESLALIYIDLDRFKNVNDSLGHTAGDEVLRLAAARIRSMVRETDTLARLGGDEFIVIASPVEDTPPHVLAERLQEALGGAATSGGAACFIEASIGIAMYPQDGATAEVLLRNADTAMYRAKAGGGGRVVYFEERMNVDARRRMKIEERLRAALARGVLTLAYQPKIGAQDGAFLGVEALARWTDEELGEVSPTEFIAVAEECGLIEELGEWAMRAACTAYQAWLGEGVDVGHVSVNVSLRQLRDERFVRCVRRILRETGTSPNALELEVTESTLAQRTGQLIALLEELRSFGVRIAIDDFGVGYSSMAALGHLPADVLKIDRSFIEHCATRMEAAAVVEAIISMAHALGKVAVAEGVETEQQLALLRRFSCDVIQGFLFSPPLPPQDIVGYALARRTGAPGAGPSRDYKLQAAAGK